QLLTDDQWALIADYLPAPTSRRGRPFSDPRQMIEGIIYRYRTGIAWRDLPETFGKWQTVWTWHRRLAADGTWDAIHQALTAHALPLVSICTAGQDGDSPMLAPLLENLQVGRRTRPDAVLGDKAYSSRANRSLLRSRKIEAVISEPSDQKGHRLRRGSKGGRPPKFDAIKYKGRNVIERGYARLKQWRGLATRYDKLAVVYRAAVVLNGVIAWLQHLSDTP